MTIGDRVKKCRIEKGLTQSELAAKLGYKSKSSVAHIENGRDIPRSMVVMLADALDTSPAYLMGWHDPPSVNESAEHQLLQDFRTLNEDGQTAALAAVHGFTMVDQYKKCKEISEVS